MSGASHPASSIRCLISGTAAAASGTLTVTRTISEPASANSIHCCAVPAASAVSVIVMDCTATGAPPPTRTRPTLTPTVLCRRTVDDINPSYRTRNPEPRTPNSEPRTPNPEPLERPPAVPQEEAANLFSARERQFERLVVLGPVHHVVEKPGDRGLRIAWKDGRVRGRIAARHAPQNGGVAWVQQGSIEPLNQNRLNLLNLLNRLNLLNPSSDAIAAKPRGQDRLEVCLGPRAG